MYIYIYVYVYIYIYISTHADIRFIWIHEWKDARNRIEQYTKGQHGTASDETDQIDQTDWIYLID